MRTNNGIYIFPLICMFLFAGIACAAYTHIYAKTVQSVFALSANQKIIVIDAGHGGWDPGKPGNTGADEKDINLKIADNLQTYLENSGAIVFITRNSDDALSKRKRGDLFQRKEIANTMKADIVVSIHQNSFPQEGVKGAQVFYYNTSDKSAVLAEKVQKEINEFADTGNKRVHKPNDSYYILKNTSSPAIIVECGFLTNYADEKKLNTEQYQEKIAWAIYAGINDYFRELE